MTLRTEIILFSVSVAIVLIAWCIFTNQTRTNYPRPRDAHSDCKAIFLAQEIYHRTDHDKDGVLEYATRLRDLIETKSGLEDLLIVPPAVAQADDSRSDRQPRNGYYFKILTAGGEAIKGGKQSFLKDGNLVLAHALLAYPAVSSDADKLPSYFISSTGIVYEKWLGPNPITAAQSINEYNPDSTWKESE